MDRLRLTGLIYTGRRDRSALDPDLWSSTAGRLFGELARRDRLHRAAGIAIPLISNPALLIRYGHWSRNVWKARLRGSVSYREALTKEVGRTLRPSDMDGPCFQMGAMFDAPHILDGRAKCFSYHDGCLAERLKSPLPSLSLSAREIDRTLEFERRVYSSMDKVFTFSRYLRDSIIANYGIDRSRVVTVGSGINLDSIPEPASDKRYDSQEILFIGVDFERKGGRHLLQAFRAVRVAYPSAVRHIVGPETLRIPGELSQNVQWHGFLSKRIPHENELLERLFKRASLFVMPSMYEPFGIAPLEAMANGIPAVVSNGGALSEMVKPGVTGELVEVGSASDLADRIRALLASPDRLGKMGKQAREEVLSQYRWELVVDRLLTAMDSLAGRDAVRPDFR